MIWSICVQQFFKICSVVYCRTKKNGAVSYFYVLNFSIYNICTNVGLLLTLNVPLNFSGQSLLICLRLEVCSCGVLRAMIKSQYNPSYNVKYLQLSLKRIIVMKSHSGIHKVASKKMISWIVCRFQFKKLCLLWESCRSSCYGFRTMKV